MKRKLTLVLCSILLLVILVGCKKEKIRMIFLEKAG